MTNDECDQTTAGQKGIAHSKIIPANHPLGKVVGEGILATDEADIHRTP